MVVIPRLVASLPGRITTEAKALLFDVRNHSGQVQAVVSESGELSVRWLDFRGGRLATVVAFKSPWPQWRKGRDAVALDRSFAVFSGKTAICAVDADGGIRWEHQHDCWGCGDLERGSVIVSDDGQTVWATAPSPHSHLPGGRYEGDDWLVLDAATGTVLGQSRLETAAASSFHCPHPDGVQVGLAVGEGQDGTPAFWGTFADGQLSVRDIGDADRVIVDIDPSGTTFLTVAHHHEDVAVHDCASGEVLHSITADDLFALSGKESSDAYVDHQAGYISAGYAMATATHYARAEDEGMHWVFSATTGKVTGRVRYPSPVTGGARPLGDGTWLTTGAGQITRWALT